MRLVHDTRHGRMALRLHRVLLDETCLDRPGLGFPSDTEGNDDSKKTAGQAPVFSVSSVKEVIIINEKTKVKKNLEGGARLLHRRRTRMESEGLEYQLVLARGESPSLLVGLIGRCSMLVLIDHRGVLSPLSSR